MARNPEINSKCRLTALRTPNGLQQTKIPEADCTSPLPERGEGHENEPAMGIQLPRATAFDRLLPSEEMVLLLTIRLGDCQGWLRASLEGITEGERTPRMLNGQAGAAAVVAAEE
jgi:hypothetical protein